MEVDKTSEHMSIGLVQHLLVGLTPQIRGNLVYLVEGHYE